MSKVAIQVDDYERGKRDCEAGHPHLSGQSTEYDNGYSDQYTHEQILTERTK